MVIASAGLAGCADDFDPFNELNSFRVLAVRADQNYLGAGESTAIVPLTFAPGTEAVTYAWEWCPVTAGQDREYTCAVTQAQLQQAVDQAIGPGVVTVPPLELGTTSSVSFSYDLPPALFQGLCDALRQLDLPSFVPTIDCEQHFPITVRLVATQGAERVVAVKELRLLYDAAAPRNANPFLGELSYRLKDEPRSAAKVIDPAAPPTLTRDREYTFSVAIPGEAAESYQTLPDSGMPPLVTKREVLVTTWFVTGGETDSIRTTFIDGEISLEEAGENVVTTPKKVDYTPDTLGLVLVIRDGRGGMDWLEREVKLGE
ncbi:hypothetical protein L6R52_19145 [Myxococcota bacterium]|nr:hypothetical protein [Myxococcota bacterium]